MIKAGQKVLVTGSTSGIGLSILTAFAENGARLFMHGIGDKAAIEKTRGALSEKTGAEILLSHADLSRTEGLEDLTSQVATEWGGADILVNNAGMQHVAPIEDFDLAKWDQLFAVNLRSAFFLTKAFVPHMKKQGFGRIINIASTHGLVASPNKSAYVASKHGLVGFTKVAGLEYANSGITVNAICPGWVRTPLVEAQIQARAKSEGKPAEEIARNLVLEKQAYEKFNEGEDIAALALFLSSAHAKSITGSAITMDGGWTAQ